MENKSVTQSLLTVMFAVLVLAASNSIVRAIDCPPGASVWTDGVGSWFDQDNWDNGVPENKCALIDNDGVATIDSTHGIAYAHALYLGTSQGDSGSVTVDGGDLDIQPNFPFPDCPGTTYVGKKGTGTLTIQNGGTATSRFLYIGAETNPTQPNSNGTVTVESGASLIINSGECLGAGICIGCDVDGNTGGTAVLEIKDAAVEVDNNAFASPTPGVKVGPSGTLKGNSVLTLTGDTSTIRTASILGTLAPSGTFRVEGNLDLSVNGINSANTICHVTPTANDKIEVKNATGGGQVTLGGRVTVIMIGTFTPGSTFTLLHADGGRNNSTFAYTTILSIGSGCYTPTIVYDDTNKNVNLYLAPRNRCAIDEP